MKIAVTGANGYLGSAVASHLSGNHEIVELSRSSVSDEDSIAVGQDLFDLKSARLEGVDCVIHAAGVADSRADKTVLDRGNVKLSRHVAQIAVQAKVNRLINISFVKACGEGDTSPSARDCPETEYGKSKLAAEMAVNQVLMRSETQVQHIRLPLVYSRNSTNNFAKLLKLARSWVPIPVNALTGNRSYCSVLNLLSFLEVVLKAGGHGVVYVADKQPISLDELLSVLARVQGRRLIRVPFPTALLKASIRAVKPSLGAQLFTESIVDLSQTHNDYTEWSVETTQACIEREFDV